MRGEELKHHEHRCVLRGRGKAPHAQILLTSSQVWSMFEKSSVLFLRCGGSALEVADNFGSSCESLTLVLIFSLALKSGRGDCSAPCLELLMCLWSVVMAESTCSALLSSSPLLFFIAPSAALMTDDVREGRKRLRVSVSLPAIKRRSFWASRENWTRLLFMALTNFQHLYEQSAQNKVRNWQDSDMSLSIERLSTHRVDVTLVFFWAWSPDLWPRFLESNHRFPQPP